jgi:hypothetical protein
MFLRLFGIKYGICAAVAILLLTSAVAQADLTVGEDWQRLTGTTGLNLGDWQLTWSTGTGGGGYEPYPAAPSLDIIRGEQGVPEDHTLFRIFVPNWVDNLPRKDISGFISVGSFSPVPTISVYGEDDGLPVIGSITLTPDYANMRYIISGLMEPNPDFETIEVLVGDHPSIGMPINEICINTVCPEPTTLGFLASGGLGLLAVRVLRLRRRRAE